MIRDHGDAVEADLAFRGVDLMDVYRGRMSLRRLWVLVKALPEDSLTWLTVAAEAEQANKPAVDKLRERQAHYNGTG